MKIPPHHDPACFGCGDNPIGFHLPLPECEGVDRYETTFSFDERHQGGPGLAQPLLARAFVEETKGPRVHIRGELLDDAEPLAEARMAFVHVPLEHFLVTPEGRAAGEAWRRRLAGNG